MIILGKELSEKTAQTILNIEKQLHKPVIYKFTDPKKTKSYGQCDAWQPDAYYVYSSEKLLNGAKKRQVNIPFETNLLHELFHLCQIEENYPCTGTLQTPQTLENLDFYDSMGSLFSSSILDLNVDLRLKQLGYTSSYFYTQRIIQADKIARRGHVCTDALDFVRFAVQLMCLNLSYPNESMQDLLQLYLIKNPGLVQCVQELSQGISKIGFHNAEECFRSLVFLFSAFNLWATHVIYFQEKMYDSLDSVCADFPDVYAMDMKS